MTDGETEGIVQSVRIELWDMFEKLRLYYPAGEQAAYLAQIEAQLKRSFSIIQRTLLLMPNPKRPRDVNQLAKMIVDIATGGIDEEMPEISIKAKAGRLGGLKGGQARKDALTPERRSEIAREAAKKRWSTK